MDNKHLKILELLRESGANNPTDISQLLITMFPDVDKMNGFDTRWAGSIIHKILEDMKTQGWIEVPQYVSLGSGNDSNGYTWLDIVHINASITSKGIEKLEEELNKPDSERLTESIIEANQSNMQTNIAVIKNLEFQKSAQKWSIGIAIASTAFILVTIILSILDKTPQRLQDIETQLKTQGKEMQDIHTSAEKINISIQKLKPDTVIVKTIN